MKRRPCYLTVVSVLVLSALGMLLLSCQNTVTKGNAGQNGAATGTPSPAPTANEPSTSPNGANRELSLVSLSAGAFPVKTPTEAYAHSTYELLDERAASAWRSEKGASAPHVFVLALPEKTLLKTVEFDCKADLYNQDGAGAKDVAVEVSDVSETDGFQKIADVSLEEGADNQKFPVSASIPGRWVRLTIKTNHGSKESYQLNDFRATGTQLTHTALTGITGTYDMGSSKVLYLKQEGTSISGCFNYLGHLDNLVAGGIEDKMVKFTYCNYCNNLSQPRGVGVLVFSPDAQKFIGLSWAADGTFSDYGGDHWQGTKTSSEVGQCLQWASEADDTLTKDLEASGRTRVYGINFDSDSDHIKDESKPLLDRIVAMLKAKPDWKITIEGHTDSTSTPQHNQELSERRAASVKTYLQSAGIDSSRLKTVGYGATKPVANNETELGRAQNRRVELTKQ